MKNLIFCACLSLLVAACSKDKFNTKPTLTYKGVNTKTVPRNSDLIFDLNVTDAEGDLNDTITVLKVVRNCSGSSLTDMYKLPVFPTKTKLNVNIQVAYTYGQTANNYFGLGGQPCVNKNDSTIFKFVIKDKAGNRSDTVSSSEVVILR